MDTNGHTNGQAATIAPKAAPQSIVIRVFRIEPGVTAYVRMLSPEYGGVFTHYHRGRSQYCTGRDCVSPGHRIDRVWKGYVAAQAWEAAGNKWFPICLEITEALELSFRGLYARGQVWELWREIAAKGKAMPVMGKLHEELEPLLIPKPFDIIPCLRALYHVDVIDMSACNPLPPRVMVDVSIDEGPEALKPKFAAGQELPEGYSAAEEFKRRQKEKAKTTKSPNDNKPAYKR